MEMSAALWVHVALEELYRYLYLITTKVAINTALPLQATHGNDIVAYFRFHINLLLLLSFDQAIFILCLHWTSHKISNFRPFILRVE